MRQERRDSLLKDQAETLRRSRLSIVKESLTREGPSKNLRVLSFTSGKGGVGKTFSVVNTAIGLSQLGKRVAILDADLGLANVDLMLGLYPNYTIEDVIRGEKEIDEVVLDGPHGVKVIPAASGIDCLTSLSMYQRLVLVDALERSSLQVDYLLIDTPAGIGTNVLFFNSASTEIVCVITPDLTSLTDAYALIKLLSTRYHERTFSILINNIGAGSASLAQTAQDIYERLANSLERFLQVRTNYLGFIPADVLAVEALQGQRALVDLYPGSIGGRALTRLAKRIDAETGGRKLKGGVQFFFQNLLEVYAE
jgi:flagellar biosynthesis protein FlhG